MPHLAPVGSDHVGGGRQASGAAEFGHHLAARVAALCAARVFGIGQHIVLVAAQADGLGQRPRTVRVQRDARLGKGFGQRGGDDHFVIAAQHAALELEILEAVAGIRGLGQTHHGFGRERLFVAQAGPVVGGVAAIGVVQVGALAVAHEEQVAKHRHLGALLPLPQQRRHGHAQVLAEQIEQRAFQRRHRMHGGAQVKRLQPTATGITIGKLAAHAVKHVVVRTDRLSDNQRRRVFNCLADGLATRHFAHAGVTFGVFENNDVAGKERAVGAAQVQ